MLKEISELNKIMDNKISELAKLDEIEDSTDFEIVELEKKIIKYFFDKRVKFRRDFLVLKNLVDFINEYTNEMKKGKLNELVESYCV